MSGRDAMQRSAVARSEAVILLLMVLVCVVGIVGSFLLGSLGVIDGYLWWNRSAAADADLVRGRTTVIGAMATGAGATVILALLRIVVRGRIGTAAWLGLLVSSAVWTVLLLVVGGAIVLDMAEKAGL